MKRWLFFIVLAIMSLRSYSFAPTDDTQLSILVCSPGEDLYAKFGHAALRIRDDNQSFDFVFDYGTFSIEDLFQFVGNFFTGKTYYMLDAKDFRYTKLSYEFEGRGIVEYPLNLTSEEKKNICNFIRINMLPNNRAYLYNFFYDNCATRLRDLLSSQVAGLSWNESYEEETWRSVILKYVGQSSLASLGIHLALGVPTDDYATKNELLFLPDAIASVCETATCSDGRKLCEPPQVVVENDLESSQEQDDTALSPLWLFFVLVAVLTGLEFYKKKWFVWLDVLLFFVFGITGCALWFLSFVSIHSFVFPNCNTLWLTPFHIVFAISLLIPMLRKKAHWYLLYASIMVIVSLIISLVVGQFVAVSAYPLALIMICRGIRLKPKR